MVLNILHDETRLDRLTLLKNEIEQECISPVFWPAIKMTKAMEGIRVSHQRIVRHAKTHNYPMIAIAEDDFHFTGKGGWQYFLSQIPEDFDLYLASIYAGNLQEDNTCTWFAGLSLFIVAARFYEKFLSVPTGKHIDRGLKNMGRFVVCNPFCCIQHETYSENQKKVLINSKYLSNAKFYEGEK